MPKLLIAVKHFMEADGGRRCTMDELKEFKNALSESDRTQFTAELTQIMGVEVENS